MHIVAVSKNPKHGFSKTSVEAIRLIENHGVEGDAHAGRTIQHVYLAKKDPARKNLLQVHLIASELLEELDTKGFAIKPGELGENITTAGIDLLALPTGTRLTLGSEAVIELTALRNPCVQIEKFRKGLLKEVVSKDSQGNIQRRIGIMAVVLVGGEVRPGDPIGLELPPEPHQPLAYVW